MAGESNVTRDHETIRRWVEERGGWPATVVGTGRRNEPGLLRIDFPGYSGKGRLQKIDWDEFFDKFDDENLEFLYQDRTADGKTSRFSKFVSEKTAKAVDSGSRRRGGAKRSASKTSSRSGASRSRSAGKSASKSSGRKSASSSSTKSGAKRATTSAKSRSGGSKAAAKSARTASSRKSASKASPSKSRSTASRAASRNSGAAAKRTASSKKSASKSSSTKRSAAKSSAKKATASRTSSRTSAKKSASSARTVPASRSAAKKSSRTATKSAAKSTGRTSRSGVTTTDHDEIRQWVEKRGGWPAHVKGTGGRDAGLLRIDYPGFSGKGTLERISWDDFFETFDDSGLAFLYQDKPNSRFSKLVRRRGSRR